MDASRDPLDYQSPTQIQDPNYQRRGTEGMTLRRDERSTFDDMQQLIRLLTGIEWVA